MCEKEKIKAQMFPEVICASPLLWSSERQGCWPPKVVGGGGRKGRDGEDVYHAGDS